jgi:hypothetical protein
MTHLRESVIGKLEKHLRKIQILNLSDKLQKTVQKIKESPSDLVNLYKLDNLTKVYK